MRLALFTGSWGFPDIIIVVVAALLLVVIIIIGIVFLFKHRSNKKPTKNSSYCTKCGKPIQQDAKYCSECGHSR